MHGDVVVEIHRVVERTQFCLAHSRATIVKIKNTWWGDCITANANLDLLISLVALFTWVNFHFFAPRLASATRYMSDQNRLIFLEHDHHLFRQINFNMTRRISDASWLNYQI